MIAHFWFFFERVGCKNWGGEREKRNEKEKKWKKGSKTKLNLLLEHMSPLHEEDIETIRLASRKGIIRV